MAQRRRYLSRRGLRWQYRRRVPVDLRAAVGRVLWVVALGTRDPGVARARAARVDAKLETAIRGLRLRLAMADEGTISRLARIYFDRLLAECREYRSSWVPAKGVDPEAAVDREIETYDVALDFERDAMIEGDRTYVEPLATALAAEFGEELQPEQFQRLNYELQRVRLRVIDISRAEWAADFSGGPRRPTRIRMRFGVPVWRL